MYSQNAEEQFIVEYFSGVNNGKFLDIGAYDGKTFSNTKKLHEQGWSGVCLEPDPIVYEALAKLYEGDDTVKTLNYAFAETNGTLKFYSSGGDAVSTTSIKHRDKWIRGSKVKFTETTVQAINAQSLFEQYGSKYDFISLDVEGTNYQLLQQLPLTSLETKLICVEYDHRLPEIIDYCKSHGLTRIIYESSENIIMGK